jgi:hypothetical protein
MQSTQSQGESVATQVAHGPGRAALLKNIAPSLRPHMQDLFLFVRDVNQDRERGSRRILKSKLQKGSIAVLALILGSPRAKDY